MKNNRIENKINKRPNQGSKNNCDHYDLITLLNIN